jgi:hypothetical protein
MFWYAPSSDHRIFLPLKLLGEKTSFTYKLIVDGEWLCDGSKEMEEDRSGNVNNVFRFTRPSTPVIPATPKVGNISVGGSDRYMLNPEPSKNLNHLSIPKADASNIIGSMPPDGDLIFRPSSLSNLPPPRKEDTKAVNRL